MVDDEITELKVTTLSLNEVTRQLIDRTEDALTYAEGCASKALSLWLHSYGAEAPSELRAEAEIALAAGDFDRQASVLKRISGFAWVGDQSS